MSLIKTILVDDDYLVLKDLRSMIDWKALGFSIEETASTGKAALRLASDCKPSLVITDIVVSLFLLIIAVCVKALAVESTVWGSGVFVALFSHLMLTLIMPKERLDWEFRITF